jgi:hypothetical protein
VWDKPFMGALGGKREAFVMGLIIVLTQEKWWPIWLFLPVNIAIYFSLKHCLF